MEILSAPATEVKTIKKKKNRGQRGEKKKVFKAVYVGG